VEQATALFLTFFSVGFEQVELSMTSQKKCSQPRAGLVWTMLIGMWLGSSTTALLHAEDPPTAVGPVMKLFKSGRLPPERQGTVVEMICNRGNEHDLRVIFNQLIQPEGFSRDLRLKVIGWLTDAAATRKILPTGELDSLGQVLESQDADQQLAAIRLATAWKLRSVSKAINSIATNPKTTPSLLQAAIGGLVAIGGDESKSTLLGLASKTQPSAIRMQAITGLVSLDLDVASQQAALVLADSKGNENIQEMVTAFLNLRQGADKLADAIKEQRLSVDAAKMTLRFMYSIGRSDASLSDVLSQAAGVATDPQPPTQEEVARLAEQVIARGDAAKGESVFRRSDLSCMKCHSINRAGGQVGPDLSAIGVSSPVDYVINSILNPNLAVKEQYVITIFLLDDGRVLNGVVVDRDDDRVLIRDSQGATITVATADIESEKEGKSQMPQGLTKFLTNDEVIDLAKFISELGKPGPYAIRKTPSIQRWHWMKEPSAELTNDVPHLENIRELVLNSKPEQWSSVYGKVSGVLPLNELRTGDSPRVVLLQGEVQLNEAGKLTFQLTSTERFQVWLNDQPFESRNQFDAILQPGRHKLTLRLEISNSANPELKIDVSKPSDSTAQFEVVGGT
jgi:putative heme-binding domain-containing protein